MWGGGGVCVCALEDFCVPYHTFSDLMSTTFE